MAVQDLTGLRYVRVIRPALHDSHRLLPKMKDRYELRRQALKLRYWPDNYPTDELGSVLDLDWSWIRCMRGMNVGELRISEAIGGHKNLRVIFYETSDIMTSYNDESPLPIIWILAAFPKKRDDFSSNMVDIIRSRRLLVRKRFYDL